jgi:hypothetical protein
MHYASLPNSVADLLKVQRFLQEHLTASGKSLPARSHRRTNGICREVPLCVATLAGRERRDQSSPQSRRTSGTLHDHIGKPPLADLSGSLAC